MSWLDLHLHHASGLPRIDSTVVVTVLGISSCVGACVGGVAFFGAWHRAKVSLQPGQEVEFEVQWSEKPSEEKEGMPAKMRVLAAAGKVQLQGGAGWVDSEVALEWRPGHQEQAEAADAESNGFYDEERVWAMARGARLRLSYCLSPLLGLGQQEGPELSGSPMELPIPTLELHTYAHGGFMGAAASMMADGKWRAILEREDPESFKKAFEVYTKLLSKKAIPNKTLAQLMGVLENSPVLCAYGLVRQGCTSQVTPVHPAAQHAAQHAASEPAANGFFTASGGLASTAPHGTFDAHGGSFISNGSIAASCSYVNGGSFITNGPIAASCSSTYANGGAFAANVPVAGSGFFASSAPIASNGCYVAADTTVGSGSYVNGTPYTSAPGEAGGPTEPRHPPRHRSPQLDSFLASLGKANPFGYIPTALEWDLWIHPKHPAHLKLATVDHGTPMQLVTQAITTVVPGLHALARKAGVNQIYEYGVSPIYWMNALGHAINQAVNGDREAPLPLAAQEESFYRLSVDILRLEGGAAAVGSKYEELYVQGSVEIPSLMLECPRTKKNAGAEGACWWNEELQFWPLPLDLGKAELSLEVYGARSGKAGEAVGSVRLNLQQLMQQHPQLEQGKAHIQVELPLGPPEQRSPKAGSKGDLGAGMSGTALTGGYGNLLVRLMGMEKVGTLAAAQSLGVTPAAAQTCLAMLSKPGGLYLDVKSAYSTAKDIQRFVTVLLGIGVHCKAVCSFKAPQLEVGSVADTVLFYHGVSGLENGCDGGAVSKGQFVLFNGASLLADLDAKALKASPAAKVRQALSATKSYPVDASMVCKYIGLVEAYDFAGGIYVQEPDASAAALSALTQLCNDYPQYFPLGFAYGHLPGAGVNFIDLGGRGLGGQELMEELQARTQLSGKVIERVRQGKHETVGPATLMAWSQRLMAGSFQISFMGTAGQRTLLVLLGRITPDSNVHRAVHELGGARTLFLRFFQEYKIASPKIFLEATSGEANPVDELAQLLRDRGVLAAHTLPQKVELARFFYSRQLKGAGLTRVLKKFGMHKGLHKLPREGLLCLLESCTQAEFQQVINELGGLQRVYEDMEGRGSGRSAQRLADIQRALAGRPDQPACLSGTAGRVGVVAFDLKPSSLMSKMKGLLR